MYWKGEKSFKHYVRTVFYRRTNSTKLIMDYCLIDINIVQFMTAVIIIVSQANELQSEAIETRSNNPPFHHVEWLCVYSSCVYMLVIEYGRSNGVKIKRKLVW